MVEVANSTTTSVTANQIIPFTANTFDTNNRMYFDASTNSIVITKVGKYEVNGSFVFAPTSAGDVTVTAYANGTAIPYDIATNTVSADGTYTFTLPQKIVNVVRSSSNNNVKITFEFDAAGSIINALASVNYVE